MGRGFNTRQGESGLSVEIRFKGKISITFWSGIKTRARKVLEKLSRDLRIGDGTWINNNQGAGGKSGRVGRVSSMGEVVGVGHPGS